MMLFLVVWVALALSLNLRDARKRKRLQQARQQAKAPETVPVEQVICLAEWNMQQGVREGERESNRYVLQMDCHDRSHLRIIHEYPGYHHCQRCHPAPANHLWRVPGRRAVGVYGL